MVSLSLHVRLFFYSVPETFFSNYFSGRFFFFFFCTLFVIVSYRLWLSNFFFFDFVHAYFLSFSPRCTLLDAANILVFFKLENFPANWIRCFFFKVFHPVHEIEKVQGRTNFQHKNIGHDLFIRSVIVTHCCFFKTFFYHKLPPPILLPGMYRRHLRYTCARLWPFSYQQKLRNASPLSSGPCDPLSLFDVYLNWNLKRDAMSSEQPSSNRRWSR